MVESIWESPYVKSIAGSDVNMLDKLGCLKMMGWSVASMMVLWTSKVLDDFANSEVGKPQPQLFEGNKPRESNGLGKPPELNLNL